MIEYYQYLSTLRESGECNMLEGPKRLEAEFDLPRGEAREVFAGWCKWMEEGCPDLS